MRGSRVESLLTEARRAIEAALAPRDYTLTLEQKSYDLDPWGGGIQWWKCLRLTGLPELSLSLEIQDILWSHTEVRLTLDGSDPALVANLRAALTPLIRASQHEI